MTRFLVSVVGPTAIGKTSLAIKLATYFNTEIISADSRQFYKEMSIGTAVPLHSQLAKAPHHFIQNKSVKDYYNAGDFEHDAISKIKLLHQTKPIVVMVGGSGLFVKAVTHGLDYFPEINANIRTTLNHTLKTEGLIPLQNQLKKLDVHAYNSIAINNPQRVIRALEICIGTGKMYSSFLTNSQKKREFKTLSIGLDAERSIIYDRINERVDQMINNGLIDEAQSVYKYKNLNTLNTVGYKELFNYFNGEIDLETAIFEIKKNTRRFAKRQLTWFKKDLSIKWFNYKTDNSKVIKYIEDHLKL